jgi:hypothetical protein
MQQRAFCKVAHLGPNRHVVAFHQQDYVLGFALLLTTKRHHL